MRDRERGSFDNRENKMKPEKGGKVFSAKDSAKITTTLLRNTKEKVIPTSLSTSGKANNKEANILRPRKEIQEDREGIAKAFEQLNPEALALNSIYNSLSSQQQRQSDALLQNPTAIGKNEVDPTLRSFLLRSISLDKKVTELIEQETTLKREELPYVVDDVKKMGEQLSATLDYDAIFAYYAALIKGEKEPLDNSDLLSNTVRNLYTLRQSLQYISYPLEKIDPDLLAGCKNYLSEQRLLWGKKGFLKERKAIALKDSDASAATTRKRREQVKAEVATALDQLDEYRTLIHVYRPAILKTPAGVYDQELSEIERILGNSREDHYFGNDFKDIELDSQFIDAAKRRIDAKLLLHRREGRLPKTPDVLLEERARIDAIDSDTAFDRITFQGFDVPEGTTPLFSPSEFIQRAKAIVPPDFVQDLVSISYNPDVSITMGDGDKVAGIFLPIFGEGKNWDQVVARRIVIFEAPYVPNETDPVEKIFARSAYSEIPWHELAHNGHNLLDYDEMVAWEQIVKNDTTAITPYVKKCKEMGENRRKREDFAESFELFLRSPLLLKILSFSRYDYMNEYFRRHLSSQQVETFEKEKQKKEEISLGLYLHLYQELSPEETIERIRKENLAHEQEE